MADGQPPEPNVQILVDPVEPVVNPPVGNQNENAAQPQELEVVVFQSLWTFRAVFSCLSYLSGFYTARLGDSWRDRRAIRRG